MFLGNGTTVHVSTSGTITGPTAVYTWACLYQNASAPAIASPFSSIFSITADGTLNLGNPDYEIAFHWNHPDAAFYKAFIHRQADFTYKKAQLTSTPAINTRHAIAGTYDGTNMRVYFNGALETTTAATPLTNLFPKISLLSYNAGATGFDSGRIAEYAFWSATLGPGDIAALHRGVSPLLIRPSDLIIYVPCIRDVIQVFGPALTSVAPTIVAHPRVYYPISESMSRFTNEDNGQASFSVSTSDSLTATETGPLEVAHVRDSLAVTAESYVVADAYGRLEDNLGLVESFEAQGPYLATGLAQERYR